MSTVIGDLDTFKSPITIDSVKREITLVTNQALTNLILKSQQFIIDRSLIFRTCPEIESLKIEIVQQEDNLKKLTEIYEDLLQQKYTQYQIIIDRKHQQNKSICI
jgi:hypothetical protein